MNNPSPVVELETQILSHSKEGDKITLPSSYLESILNFYNNTLPTPLTFKLSYNNKVLHVGVLEFANLEDKIGIPLWIQQFFETKDECFKIKIEPIILEKGTWAKLESLDNNINQVKDLRAILESNLRLKYTTLTEGQIIIIKYGLELFQFKVLKLKPNPAINIIDTDLEVEIDFKKETNDNLKLNNQTKSIIKKNIQLNEILTLNCLTGNKMIFEFLLSEQKDYIIELISHNFKGPDLFIIPGDRIVDEQNHIWASIGTLKKKYIIIKSDDEGFKVPLIYSLCISSDFDCKVDLIINEFKEEKVKKETTLIESNNNHNEIQCDNCYKLISKVNFNLHKLSCQKFNQICKICNQIILKEQSSTHYHCPQCLMILDKEDEIKHNQFYHEPIHCNCSLMFNGQHELAKHQILNCKNRLIECRFCHDKVKYEDKSSDPADWEQDLNIHEGYCGSRTILCSKCQKHIPLKKIRLHAKYHEMEKQSQPLPFIKCSNRNCIRSIQLPFNELRLCAPCFAPFWSPSHDPNLKLLRQKVALKYHQQLTLGCKNNWCQNLKCATFTKIRDPTEAALELLPLLTIPLKSNMECYFCVDQNILNKKVLSDQLFERMNKKYDIIWCIHAIQKVGNDLNEAEKWLIKTAPKIQT